MQTDHARHRQEHFSKTAYTVFTARGYKLARYITVWPREVSKYLGSQRLVLARDRQTDRRMDRQNCFIGIALCRLQLRYADAR